jgi:Uma2 family endonuclease
VEVAISSVELDRAKVELYAAAGVPELWLVLPKEGTIEVHREPAAEKYGSVERFAAGQSLSPLTLPNLSLQIDQLFD